MSPAYPILARRLDLGIATAGLAAGLLNASIAVGAVLGGLFFARRGAQGGAVLGLSLSAAGGFVTAVSSTLDVLLVGQSVGGFGSGMFFASGLSAIAVLAGTRRRGLAIAVFSLAFSGGVALGPMMVAIAGADRWRIPFVLAASFSTLAAAVLLVRPIPPTRSEEETAPPRSSFRAAWVPIAVGGVAAISQYGTIFFLPLFAVTVWDVSPAAAASLLLIARLLSVPSKLLAGNSSDRGGAVRIAKRHALIVIPLGLWWTIAPTWTVGAWAAVLYVAIISTLGPLGNVIAYDSFGKQGVMLGVLRSVQIGLGAAAAAAIGAAAERFSLRPVLAIAAAAPLILLLLRPGPHEPA